ncbi:MAG: cation transporting ATPase C-terminal domain-containing protein [Halanaerobiales bacterium]
MKSPSRKQEEHIVDKKSFTEILFLGILMGGLGFLNFGIFNMLNGGGIAEGGPLYDRATTISYLTIVVCQWFNILSRRYETTTFFSKTLFTNMKMLYSILISVVMVSIVIYTPAINQYLGFYAVTSSDWLRIILAGIVFLVTHEIIKWFKRREYYRKV